MKAEKSNFWVSRRDFIKKSLAGGTITGIGCSGLMASLFQESELNPAPTKANFQAPSNFSYEQVFNFAFKNWYIRYMKGLEAEIGRENLLEMLKKVGWQLYEDSVNRSFRDLKNRNVESLISNFWAPMQNSQFWKNAIPIEIIEMKPSEGIVKMPQCLVAKTFREAEAADIGYAAICYADFAVAKTFNPKIELVRNKCIMNGDSHCLFEYSMKS